MLPAVPAEKESHSMILHFPHSASAAPFLHIKLLFAVLLIVVDKSPTSR
jgi:hypothetical protein